MIGFRTATHPIHGDERFESGDYRKIVAELLILGGLISRQTHRFLPAAAVVSPDVRICFGEELVFNTYCGNVALLKLAGYQPTNIVEIAIAGITIQQDRDTGSVTDKFANLEHLSPTSFIVIATPSAAEIDKPLAQIPLNPVCSTIRALRPLWASIKNSKSPEASSERNFLALFMMGSYRDETK